MPLFQYKFPFIAVEASLGRPALVKTAEMAIWAESEAKALAVVQGCIDRSVEKNPVPHEISLLQWTRERAQSRHESALEEYFGGSGFMHLFGTCAEGN